MSSLSTGAVPAIIESLYPLLDFVTSFAMKRGFTRDRISEIKISLEEVLVNIFTYAYKQSPEPGTVEITCDMHGKDLRIDIVDSGIPFNPCELEDPDTTLDLDEREIGGLGIYLLKKYMNEISYNREGNINRLTLVAKGN